LLEVVLLRPLLELVGGMLDRASEILLAPFTESLGVGPPARGELTDGHADRSTARIPRRWRSSASSAQRSTNHTPSRRSARSWPSPIIVRSSERGNRSSRAA